MLFMFSNFIHLLLFRVVREQYWTCSKWPRAQRVLAVAVGVLIGAVIGLAVTMGLRSTGQDNPIFGPILRTPMSD